MVDLTVRLCLISLAQAKKIPAVRPVPLATSLPVGAVPVAPAQRAAQRRIGGGQLEEVRRDGRLVRAAGAHLRHARRIALLQNLLRGIRLLASQDGSANECLALQMSTVTSLQIENQDLSQFDPAKPNESEPMTADLVFQQ